MVNFSQALKKSWNFPVEKGGKEHSRKGNNTSSERIPERWSDGEIVEQGVHQEPRLETDDHGNGRRRLADTFWGQIPLECLSRVSSACECQTPGIQPKQSNSGAVPVSMGLGVHTVKETEGRA